MSKQQKMKDSVCVCVRDRNRQVSGEFAGFADRLFYITECFKRIIHGFNLKEGGLV